MGLFRCVKAELGVVIVLLSLVYTAFWVAEQDFGLVWICMAKLRALLIFAFDLGLLGIYHVFITLHNLPVASTCMVNSKAIKL